MAPAVSILFEDATREVENVHRNLATPHPTLFPTPGEEGWVRGGRCAGPSWTGRRNRIVEKKVTCGNHASARLGPAAGWERSASCRPSTGSRPRKAPGGTNDSRS